MRNRTRVIYPAIVVICFTAMSLFAEAPRTRGELSDVTVYRGEALVTRTIGIDLPQGAWELIVEGLPGKIIPESLFAQTSGNTKVLSVRYRESAVEADTREEVKQLEDQIAEIDNKLYQNKRDINIAEWTFRTFEGQWRLAIDSTNVDLNRSVLDSNEVENFTEYLAGKGMASHKRTVALEFVQKDLTRQMELLQRKRAELDKDRSRTEREAVLYISSESKGKGLIELSYLVDGANWLPQYNLRANPAKSDVVIEYNAIVSQTSGEDWTGIELNLSTAQPAMVASAPVLEPMNVGFGSGNIQYDAQVLNEKVNKSMQSEAQQPVYRDRSKEFKELLRNRKAESSKGLAANYQLGQIAVSNQAFELSAGKEDLAKMKEQVAQVARVEGISVTYKLPGKLTLPSRTDQQLVTITAITAKADFTLVATPLLTDYVYLQGQMVNDSETIFLPGPANMFRNGEFVGKSEQPLVTMGGKFTAGFGIDSQIQAVRQLEDKKTKTQGGNRIDTYNYQVVVSNYKNTPVNLRLLDRLPYSDNESIKIELQQVKPELSKDSDYLVAERKKGILQWDLNLAANSNDQKATIVSYSLTMEYDKNMQIQPR